MTRTLTSTFKGILVANRGEIAIRILRAAAELKIRTVAIYTFEDRYSLHRFKADEAYLIGSRDEALKPYLDIEEIIALAKEAGVEAIHPGYGFLSENVEFARRCQEEDLVFVGPSVEAMERLGDKVCAKEVARTVKVPVIEGVDLTTISDKELARAARKVGLPLIIKAASGGGGRGMRIVRAAEDLAAAAQEAQREAERAFGDGTLFLERYVENPRHIEVQLLGDRSGGLVHLFERDCSVQRRFQKVVEVAPCLSLPSEVKEKLYEYALRIGREVGYYNAGTVEFLIDAQNNPYFIEVNPRIQVEHTVTEVITGVDLVRSQILIAAGALLSDPRIALPDQAAVKMHGHAIQCRITTEDPGNDFQPDFGKLAVYRSPGGFGIRLDAGSAYSGAVISPFFDSLLVKITAGGRTLKGASERLQRALTEFRIRGVNTNLAFLENVVTHEKFLTGDLTVDFIDQHPELFEFYEPLNRATKVLHYLAELIVNGHPDVKEPVPGKRFLPAEIPGGRGAKSVPAGTRDKLKELGRERFIEWLKADPAIHYTDTTFRDAHQSLLATRVRTRDLLAIATPFAHSHPELFAMEVWGGATFDVALRFLHECPWQRLELLRKAVPNILFQMLLRGSNAVGYSAYPDNLIVAFIEQAAEYGIDIFRIFDSMNWLPAMETSISAVIDRTDSLAEVAICYTGDILDSKRTKFTLAYYLDLAKRIEDTGAHILAIKDMAGLLKPYAAEVFVGELRQTVQMPIHLHTHDTAAVQSATLLKAIESGVDVVDVALASMSGLTSQPNFNSIVAMLQGHRRERPVDLASLNKFSRYWEQVRARYYPFESGLKAGTAEVYEHEIPGGQYSNLRPQAQRLGLEDKFDTVTANYRIVNDLLGDVIKVTPSSKVVGDVAMFMTANDLSREDVIERAGELAFPESLKSLFRGELGQPHGGFPEWFQKAVLKEETPLTGRANEHLKPIDLDSGFAEFKEELGDDLVFVDYISSLLYPRVFKDYYLFHRKFGDVWRIPSEAFFFGLDKDQEVLVDIDRGKTLIIRCSYVNDPDEDGIRTVVFKLNGQTRSVDVLDSSAQVKRQRNVKATGDRQVGSPLQGKLGEVMVQAGADLQKGDPLFIIEAMKMESTVAAPLAGRVKSVQLETGTLVEQDDLVIEFE